MEFDDLSSFVDNLTDCFNHLADINHSAAAISSFKILSYNVWFREDLELQKRMKAIGDLIKLHSPEIICFQVSLSLFPSPLH